MSQNIRAAKGITHCTVMAICLFGASSAEPPASHGSVAPGNFGNRGTVYVAYTVDTEARPARSLGIYSDNLDLSDFSRGGLIDRTMSEFGRGNYRDSYGGLPKYTWMLLADEFYCESTTSDCNAVYSSMEKYFDRAHAWGDLFSWHHHSLDWSDGNGDGIFYWNQLLTFNGTSYTHGTDVEMAEKMLASLVIEKGFYPSVFRSGWVWENNDFSLWLDDVVPFDFSNMSPLRSVKSRPDSLTNIYDWSRAPINWIFYHPDSSDYQRPGSLKRTVFRTSNAANDFAAAFAMADSGKDQLIVTLTHSYNGGIGMDYASTLSAYQNQYPNVMVKFVTALEGARFMLLASDTVPPVVTVTEQDNIFYVDSDKSLFSYPYGALKLADGQYMRVTPTNVSPDTSHGSFEWTFDLSTKQQLAPSAIFAVAGTTPAGSTFVSQQFTIYNQNPSVAEDSRSSLPTTFSLFQNYPNPFNGETVIEFDIPRPTNVRLVVFNVLGQKVRTLLDEPLGTGRHIARWDGADEGDQPVASGTYFFRIEAGEFNDSKIMIFLK